MYNYMSGGSNDRFDARVDYLSQPYFLPIEFFTDKDTSVARFQFSFKEFHVSYGQAIGANTSTKIDFIALTDHQLDNKGSYEYSLSANAVENSYVENSTSINYEFGWGTYTSDMPFKGPSLSAARLKSVPVPANPSPGIKESSTPFSVASLGGQTGPSAIVDKFENTTALESLDSKCVSGAGSAAYGSPVKLTCLADAAGGIPVQLMFASNSSTVPSPCFVFRSTSFNHKVTWTLGSPTNAGVFADTFAVDFPGQGSDRTFSVDITTSASADVVIKAQLYTVSNVGAVTGHGLQTAAVAGTAVTVTQTITASALSSAVTSYVILEVTKGSASSIANAAINSMGLA